MEFIFKNFRELTLQQLYDCLQLRSEVFVLEQNCVYQDIDGKDQKAIHVLGYKNDILLAYSRIFNVGDYFDNPSIGRILVKEKNRKFNYGHQLVDVSIDYIERNFKENKIEISAQKYLLKFYNSHRFFQEGDEYLEDGIPHVKMIRK